MQIKCKLCIIWEIQVQHCHEMRTQALRIHHFQTVRASDLTLSLPAYILGSRSGNKLPWTLFGALTYCIYQDWENCSFEPLVSVDVEVYIDCVWWLVILTFIRPTGTVTYVRPIHGWVQSIS